MRKLLLFMFVALSASYAFSQTKTVTGTVTDQRDGSPIPGVTVTVKGTSVSTSTQPDGTFRISIPGNATHLVFTSIGFQTTEAAIGSGSLKVQLGLNQNSLSEVIITGYAVQNKRQVSGSVAKVKGDDVKLQPVGSLDKMLQGKVAGLLSLSQTGQPGAPAVVTIRGMGSINGTNTPLYIIDGVMVTSADFATINPSDIESFNVLKDASSTSIYGSRGANGVIVISTRRGQAGKTQIDYDFQYGNSELPDSRLKLMNSAQKLNYEVNYDRPFYGKNPFGWSQTEIDSLSKINNNLKGILFRKGITQEHTLSASGGNDKTRFYLSGSIFDQQGIVIATGLKRYTGRANIENTFGDFKIGLNTTLGYSRITGTRENDAYIGSPLNAMQWFNPYVNLYDKNGNYQNDDIQGQPNPVREQLENFGNSDELKGVGSIYIEWKIPWVKGLHARTQWGADYSDNEATQYLDKSTDQGGQSIGGNGQLGRAYSKEFRYTGTSSVGYTRDFGDHSINVNVYNEIIQDKNEGFNFTGYGLLGPFKNESGITPGTSTNGYIPTVGGFNTQNSLLSYFVDAIYGYKNKYFLTAGARRDGSSVFGTNFKYASFGAVGASWIISDERFMERTSNWLSELKFKASYGSAGNQLGISDFASRELLGATTYDGTAGLILAQLPNPNLSWEKKIMFNTGVEFTLFKGRVGGTVEVYDNETKSLFLDRQLSRTSGFSAINENLGQLRNRGIELTINATIVKTKDLTWSISANYSHNQNKLINQNGQDKNVNGLLINKVGQPINSLYMTKFAGVDPANGDALYYKADGKTTTNVYDPNDAVILGPTAPPSFGGFGTNLNYKGIELDVLFSYAYGNVIYNNGRSNVEYAGYWFSGLDVQMLTEWQKPGDKTMVPSPFNDFHPETSRFAEKADFLRLRNVSLSYSLPKTLIGKWKINRVKVFAQGQNLYKWDHFLGYDPEITTAVYTGAQYPQLKTWTLGINLGL